MVVAAAPTMFRRALPGLTAGAGGLLLALAAPARALPRLDLSPYPAPAAGEQRWVIQLPGVPPAPAEAGISPSPSPSPHDWRVQLIVGREMQLDCNRHSFRGRIRSETLPGLGTPILRVTNVGPLASTRMACPPGSPLRKVFLPLGEKPVVLPYNASLPIVVYAPKDLEVRWRLWKAERQQYRAVPR
jgi:ecotin